MASSDKTPLDWRRGDPDETMGRVLARRLAEREAARSLASWRRVRIAALPRNRA